MNRIDSFRNEELIFRAFLIIIILDEDEWAIQEVAIQKKGYIK